MPYKISTKHKRSVIESTEWLKDEHKIIVTDVCRWGSIVIEKKPDLSGYNPDKGIDVVSSFKILDYESESDGFDFEISYSSSMSTEDKNKIKRFLRQHGIDEIVELGWEQGTYKTVFEGPLEVEEI